MIRILIASTMTAAFLSGGCSGTKDISSSNVPAVPVHGKVMYNGQPVTAGYVALTLVTNTDKYGPAEAVGEIKPDGTFEPQQVSDKPGLVPGKWKAIINPKYIRDGKTQTVKVPAKYTNESTSDLTIEVTEGENNPVLTLK